MGTIDSFCSISGRPQPLELTTTEKRMLAWDWHIVLVLKAHRNLFLISIGLTYSSKLFIQY